MKEGDPVWIVLAVGDEIYSVWVTKELALADADAFAKRVASRSAAKAGVNGFEHGVRILDLGGLGFDVQGARYMDLEGHPMWESVTTISVCGIKVQGDAISALASVIV